MGNYTSLKMKTKLIKTKLPSWFPLTEIDKNNLKLSIQNNDIPSEPFFQTERWEWIVDALAIEQSQDPDICTIILDVRFKNYDHEIQKFLTILLPAIVEQANTKIGEMESDDWKNPEADVILGNQCIFTRHFYTPYNSGIGDWSEPDDYIWHILCTLNTDRDPEIPNVPAEPLEWYM